MKKSTLANNFIYYLFCGFSGAVIACIVWLFLKLMSLGISFIWETVPSNINFTYYPLAVCTIGGILLGIYQKISKAVPDELEEVMKKVKRDKFYPYNKFCCFVFPHLFHCFSAAVSDRKQDLQELLSDFVTGQAII